MPLQQNGPKIVVFTVEDIGRELLKSEVRLALVDANPLSIPPIDDELILRESLKHKLYDMAWIFARLTFILLKI
jgi:hypothetical protein